MGDRGNARPQGSSEAFSAVQSGQHKLQPQLCLPPWRWAGRWRGRALPFTSRVALGKVLVIGLLHLSVGIRTPTSQCCCVA